MHQWQHYPHPAAAEWAGAMLRDRSFDVAGLVVQAAASLGTTPAAVAIAWIAARPGVTSVILGPRTLAQLQDTLAGLTLEMPPEMSERLSEISAPAGLPVTGMPIGPSVR
jgi:aryl-alcohol dehydrogenase-like predicted oxidoreductase